MTLTRLAFVLLWLFVFTIPMTYATEIPMIGTISASAGIAAMVAVVIAVAARRQVRLLGASHMAMAGYVLWSAVTLCWSVSPDLTIHRIMTNIQLLVLALLVWEMCAEERDILRMLGAFVAGTIIPALSTLKGFLPGQQTLIQRATLSGHDGGYDANQLAFLLALSLPAAYYLILKEKGPIVSLYRLQMGFAVCAILLTGSPAAMVAMVVGLSVAFWTLPTISIRTRLKAFSMMMMLVAVGLMAVPSGVWKGVGEQIRKGDTTLTTVVSAEVWRIPSTPLKGFGAGTGERPAVVVSGRLGGRPTAFTIFAETGVIGVACFLVLIGVLVFATGRMPVVDKSFWMTALAVWVVGAFSLNWDCCQPAWLIFGLLAAHSACLDGTPAVEAVVPRERIRYFDEQAEVWS